jgi:hypothetical protein
VNQMNIKVHLGELERQHKAFEHEIAEVLADSSSDYLKIAELVTEPQHVMMAQVRTSRRSEAGINRYEAPVS